MTFAEAAMAYELKCSGMTYREIAKPFAISVTHLRRIFEQCLELGKDAPLVNVKAIGRPRKATQAIVLQALKLKAEGKRYKVIARMLNCDADVIRKAVWHYSNSYGRLN